MHGDGLDDFHLKPRLFAQLFEAGDLVALPDFAHGDVVNSRDDARHVGDLPDVGKRDAVALAVPTEGHFHNWSASLMFIVADVFCRFIRGGKVVLALLDEASEIVGKDAAEEVETGVGRKRAAVGEHPVRSAEGGIFRDRGKILADALYGIVKPPCGAHLHMAEGAREAGERGELGIVQSI